MKQDTIIMSRYSEEGIIFKAINLIALIVGLCLWGVI